MKRKKTEVDLHKIAKLIYAKKFEEAKALIPPEDRHLPLWVDCLLAKPCGCHPVIYTGPLLHFATRSRDILEYLLDGGADINLKDKYEYTPLHTAVCDNREECCELLLNRGADIEIRSHWGSTPLKTAKNYKYSKIVLLLENHLVMMNLSGVIARGLTDGLAFSDFLVKGIYDPRLFIIVSQFAFK